MSPTPFFTTDGDHVRCGLPSRVGHAEGAGTTQVQYLVRTDGTVDRIILARSSGRRA
jgi:hypothetical protein